jgi:hypothetical protein
MIQNTLQPPRFLRYEWTAPGMRRSRTLHAGDLDLFLLNQLEQTPSDRACYYSFVSRSSMSDLTHFQTSSVILSSSSSFLLSRPPSLELLQFPTREILIPNPLDKRLRPRPLLFTLSKFKIVLGCRLATNGVVHRVAILLPLVGVVESVTNMSSDSPQLFPFIPPKNQNNSVS